MSDEEPKVALPARRGSSELELPATSDGLLLNPRTGAVITEDSADDDLVDFLVFLRDSKKLIDGLDGDISQWLRERADARQAWTLAGGRASMPSNRPATEWSVPALTEVLALLVADHELTPEMAADCFRVKREVDSGMVKALLAGASPKAARMINSCRIEVPKTSRRVSVSA